MFQCFNAMIRMHIAQTRSNFHPFWKSTSAPFFWRSTSNTPPGEQTSPLLAVNLTLPPPLLLVLFQVERG